MTIDCPTIVDSPDTGGDCPIGKEVCGESVGETFVTLTFDCEAPTSSNLPVMPQQTIWGVHVMIVGCETSGGFNRAFYWRYFLVENKAGLANLISVIEGVDTGTNGGEPPVGWEVEIDVPAAGGFFGNEMVSIKAHGAENETVSWNACMEIKELSCPFENLLDAEPECCIYEESEIDIKGCSITLNDGDTLVVVTGSNGGAIGDDAFWGRADLFETQDALTKIVEETNGDVTGEIWTYTHSGATETRGIEFSSGGFDHGAFLAFVVTGLSGAAVEVASAGGIGTEADSGTTASIVAPVFLLGAVVTNGTEADDRGQPGPNASQESTFCGTNPSSSQSEGVVIWTSYDFKVVDGPWKASRVGMTSRTWVAMAAAFS